jgi:hypothetical protein
VVDVVFSSPLKKDPLTSAPDPGQLHPKWNLDPVDDDGGVPETVEGLRAGGAGHGDERQERDDEQDR